VFRDRVDVFRRGVSFSVPWSDVLGVEQIPCCTPPIYRLAFRSHDPVYFSLSLLALYVVVWSWDFTGFLSFARRRIEEFRASGESG